jgi:hypothetical protein
MISNNINFRIQLKKYGGFGYNNFWQNYYEELVIKLDLNDEEKELIFSDNLLSILSWWQPPKKEEKTVIMITCTL